MSFNPAREMRVSFENELIEKAMQASLTRVEIVKNMPDKNHRIINLNINAGDHHPPIMHAQSTIDEICGNKCAFCRNREEQNNSYSV